jgi:hypothetical protein
MNKFYCNEKFDLIEFFSVNIRSIIRLHLFDTKFK